MYMCEGCIELTPHRLCLAHCIVQPADSRGHLVTTVGQLLQSQNNTGQRSGQLGFPTPQRINYMADMFVLFYHFNPHDHGLPISKDDEKTLQRNFGISILIYIRKQDVVLYTILIYQKQINVQLNQISVECIGMISHQLMEIFGWSHR